MLARSRSSSTCYVVSTCRIQGTLALSACQVLTGEPARLGVPGIELAVEPGRGVGELTRMRRPNLSTLGSSEDHARLRTDGRWGGWRWVVEAAGSGLLAMTVALAVTMVLAFCGS